MVEVFLAPKQNYSGEEGIAIFFIVIIFIFLIFAIGGGCYYNNSESFKDSDVNPENIPNNLYNALYTSPNLQALGAYLYTKPPGNILAQNYGRSGQGTSGGFLPLQGVGAGVYMKNSSNDNLALPSPRVGKIGGQPNYTTQQYSSRWIGFNNFGAPFSMEKGPEVNDKDYSNSYTISGSNERVCNSGQKCDNLRAQDWWPYVKKGAKGFTTQDSDAIVTCDSRDVFECEGGGRFLRDKYRPRWEKVLNP